MNDCQKILAQITQEGAGRGDQLLDMSLWDWSQAVALYGVWKYHLATGDPESLAWLERWFEGKLPRRPEQENINTMPQYLVLACIHEAYGRPDYLEACLRAADWLMTGLPRTELGGFQHVTLDSDNRQQLWADTVFMSVLFLAKMGALTGRRDYAEEAKRQFLLHINYLGDHATGLWNHGWSFERRDNYACAKWARGNCWFTIAAAEAAEFLPREDWATQWILDAYRLQAGTLMQLQDDSGLWHTLLDDPASYLEVSGSCGFLYGLLKGVRLGLLPREWLPALEKGARAAAAHIGADGIVGQVSYGTCVSDSLDYYRRIPLRPSGYGQNLMLMLLVEQMQHAA